MSKPNRSNLIREVISRPLERGEITFLNLGYAGVVLRWDGGVIAFDIANLLGNNAIAAFNRLDLLAFTHSHTDHYNRARARRVLKETEAHIVAQKLIVEDLKKGRGVPQERLIAAEHKKPINVDDFEVVAVDGVHLRPQVVYTIRKGGFSVFHGGDSGYCPVKDYPAKLAFLPTGFPSPTCSPESALRFTLDLKPRVAVAMHGRPVQMNEFKTLVNKELPETTVIIPERYIIETVHI